ncbi:MAG TPA: type II secretion system protein [Phycisphaerae bacterium]|nr:type II secretion system protein [Phycisphaerae bacterium]HOJ73625.1 type II secretion system protein [Phycisphaerae bacterium]HOM51566.1 type II secretion system protein [Phycisphaerae bacterium]HON67151.1 type II secretion system protein [Phycisphaerae bacterium]HOQ87398.1 type II secretion system protein [Phycisphaerae bacterium]
MVRARGLTLIEVLIVVIVLALLAAIITPQFSRAEQDTRLEVLKTHLLDVRAQIRLYRAQHGDRLPEIETFVEQMTQRTTQDGQTRVNGQHEQTFGPYLESLPINPYTGENRVSDGPVGTSDWYYDPVSGLFRANHDAAFIEY